MSRTALKSDARNAKSQVVKTWLWLASRELEWFAAERFGDKRAATVLYQMDIKGSY